MLVRNRLETGWEEGGMRRFVAGWIFCLLASGLPGIGIARGEHTPGDKAAFRMERLGYLEADRAFARWPTHARSRMNGAPGFRGG